MSPALQRLRRNAKRICAVLVLLALYQLAQLPSVSSSERAGLAARFRFVATPLPVPPGPPPQTLRPTNPNLAHIASWISAVGAAVALADVEGAGVANDACFVDTRTNRVIVAPVPGSGDRYAPFALDFSGFQYDFDDGADGLPAWPFHRGTTNRAAGVFLGAYAGGLPPPAGRAQGPRPNKLLPAGDCRRRGAVVQQRGDSGGCGWRRSSRPHHRQLLRGRRAYSRCARDGRRHDAAFDVARSQRGGAAGADMDWRDAWRPSLGQLPGCDQRGRAGGRSTWLDIGGRRRRHLRKTLAGPLSGERLRSGSAARQSLDPGHPLFTLVQGQRGLFVPKSKTLGYDSFKGMGVDFADIDARGLLDIFVSNITESYALEESNFVFINTGRSEDLGNGIAPFVDQSEARGLSRSGWSWDAKLDDFDNSGQLEVLQATGFVRGSVDRWPELQELAMANDQFLHEPRAWLRVTPGDDLSGQDHNPFYAADKDGHYVNIAPELGLEPADKPAPSRGIAIADAFGDGRLDFAVANQWGDTVFYRNLSPAAHRFLGLSLRLPVAEQDGQPRQERRLDAEPPSRPAIGAEATVTLPDGRRRTAQVDGGNGHSGKRAPELHFGLGDVPADAAIPVDLKWRDAGGVARQARLTLSPGWHTIMLGVDAGGSRNANPGG